MSAVVGWHIGAVNGSSETLKPTAQNDEVGGSTTLCIYGSITSIERAHEGRLPRRRDAEPDAHRRRLLEVLRRDREGEGSPHLRYPGLGGTAFLYAFSEGPVTAEGIAVIHGRTVDTADVFTKALPVAKIASLTRLAATL